MFSGRYIRGIYVTGEPTLSAEMLLQRRSDRPQSQRYRLVPTNGTDPPFCMKTSRFIMASKLSDISILPCLRAPPVNVTR